MSPRRLYLSYFLVALVALVAGGLMVWRAVPSPPQAAPAAQHRGPEEATGPAERGEPQAGNSPATVQEAIERSRQNAITLAAEKGSPTVVSINVLQTQELLPRSLLDEFFNPFFFPMLPTQRQVRSLGSGVIINPRGTILTNEHVVHNASEIVVTLSDGREYPAQIQVADERRDLAVLRVEGRDLPAAQLGDSDRLVLGEWVIAIGNPFGYLLANTQPTVTVGVISGLGRNIKPTNGRARAYLNMLQTDASINPGNSGGPLVNALGQVVGINSSIFSERGGFLGMGFAIPIQRAKRVLEDLAEFKEVREPWIGIKGQDLTPDLAERLSLPSRQRRGGFLVSQLDSQSPAERVGLQVGDVVTQLNGKPVASVIDWEGKLLDVRIGDRVSLTLLREGEPIQSSLVSTELPLRRVERVESELGLILTDVTSIIKGYLDLASSSGALILEVKPQSLASRWGLRPQDVLLQVNNQRIRSAAEAVRVLRDLTPRHPLTLVYEREGQITQQFLLLQ